MFGGPFGSRARYDSSVRRNIGKMSCDAGYFHLLFHLFYFALILMCSCISSNFPLYVSFIVIFLDDVGHLFFDLPICVLYVHVL